VSAATSARAARLRRDRSAGQTLVEFSLVLIPFLYLLMGVVDLGRGIYTYNGVSQAAREIARVVSVHQCSGPCATGTFSTQAAAVIATQKKLIPGLADSGIIVECTTVSDTTQTIPVGSMCSPGDYIRVTTSVSFGVVTPLLPVPNPFTVRSVAHVQVP